MTTDTTKDHYYEDAQVRKATITVKNCNYRITATGANLYRLFVLGTFLPENETLTVPAGKDVVISSNVERHLGDLATKRHEVFIVNFAEEGSISGPCIYYIEEPDYTKEEMTEIVHSNIRKGRSAWLKFRLPIFLNVLAVYPLIKLLLTLVGNIEDEVVQQNVWMGLAIMIFFSPLITWPLCVLKEAPGMGEFFKGLLTPKPELKCGDLQCKVMYDPNDHSRRAKRANHLLSLKAYDIDENFRRFQDENPGVIPK